ncbi:MAG: hypothetical protein GF390_03245 [Candidatus Pacebacteria bacterium]|nr:hypothetical protein [Candidatus Paceibacterota bacterium]
MGAVPKNKITRVERGKRRRGNRPKLTKKANVVNKKTATPLHKRGLVAAIFKTLNINN